MSSIMKTPSDISSDSIEESGWTTYFEEFSNNSLSAVSTSSSLLSNATSLAAKNIAHNNEQPQHFSLNQNISKKRKKNIITVFVDDDALEDTATFPPISSPKVFYGSHFENPKHMVEVNLFQEKGNISEQREEKKNEVLVEER
ncbi:hypothetical protein Lal_00028836 [Lupinus albus]|uniref:Uncharacterized protein n=1 Tax=Lupinus albus TaxID=3870 RepID=A0A6A4P028_LUPAL|nr:hypothetical protein Lalb_Chr19g0134811 [Lupinus albus]KAF1884947.1 hypothetical protein Lal_00028836 [Lupinus albus]